MRQTVIKRPQIPPCFRLQFIPVAAVNLTGVIRSHVVTLFFRVISPVGVPANDHSTLSQCVEILMKRMISWKWMISCCCLLLLYGCSALPEVKPWQKGNLAKEEMTFGSDGFDDAFDDHIYFSKEASSGGRGLGGGGCGCN